MQPMPKSLQDQVDSFAAAVGKPLVSKVLERFSAKILPFERKSFDGYTPPAWWADPDR